MTGSDQPRATDMRVLSTQGRVSAVAKALWIASLVLGAAYVAALGFIATAFGDQPNTRDLVAPWLVLGLIAGPAMSTLGNIRMGWQPQNHNETLLADDEIEV